MLFVEPAAEGEYLMVSAGRSGETKTRHCLRTPDCTTPTCGLFDQAGSIRSSVEAGLVANTVSGVV